MDVEFDNDDLDRLEVDPKFDGGWPQSIVHAFRKRMNMIRNAPDERTFRKSAGIHYEKLKNRKDEHSMKLNDQYRLTITFRQSNNQKIVVVLRIEDYH